MILTEICANLLDALNEERAREGNYIAGDLAGRMEMIDRRSSKLKRDGRMSSRRMKKNSAPK